MEDDRAGGVVWVTWVVVPVSEMRSECRCLVVEWG